MRENRAVTAPLLAVDAPSMLFRAFHALPDSITGADGRPVNALLGTANLVLREVELHEPRAVVLCFGPDAASYRTELYPAYHAEREAAMPDDLLPQFAAARDFFAAFGWTVATSDDLEADDLRSRHVPVRRRAGHRPLCEDGWQRQRGRSGRPGRGRRALRNPARACPRLHRPAR